MGTGPGDMQGGTARPVHTEVAWGPYLLPGAAGVDIALDLSSLLREQQQVWGTVSIHVGHPQQCVQEGGILAREVPRAPQGPPCK